MPGLRLSEIEDLMLEENGELSVEEIQKRNKNKKQKKYGGARLSTDCDEE